MYNFSLLIFLFFLLSGIAQSDDAKREKRFDIKDYSWLAGTWVGDGFGGTSEETWSLPDSRGTMMGMYRHFKSDGSINFYEFLLLDEKGIRLKHFTPELSGWEAKDEFATFKMLAYAADKIEMEGLTYQRISEDEIKIHLKIKREDQVDTEVFTMRRK